LFIVIAELILQNGGIAASPKSRNFYPPKKMISSEDHIKLELIRDAGKHTCDFVSLYM
jgi:hypothetical protein